MRDDQRHTQLKQPGAAIELVMMQLGMVAITMPSTRQVSRARIEPAKLEPPWVVAVDQGQDFGELCTCSP